MQLHSSVSLPAIDESRSVISVSVAAGNVSLSTKESRAAVIILTGAPGATRVVTVAAGVSREILFINRTTGGQAIEVEMDGGANFRVPDQGAVRLLSTTEAHAAQPILARTFCSPITAFTNMPLASTKWRSADHRYALDLSACRQARIQAEVVTPGTATAILRGYYSTTAGGTYGALDGGTGPSISIAAGGLAESAWADLAAAAKAPVYVQVFGDGGDGVVDPTFQHVTLEFR